MREAWITLGLRLNRVSPGKCLPVVPLHTLTGGRREGASMEQKKDYKSQILITTKISCNQLQGDPKGISELLEKGGHEIARDPGQQYYKKP